MKNELPRYAVLIDADNFNHPAWIEPILKEIRRYGRVTVSRIYGDFTTPDLAGWRRVLAENAIQPVQQYRNTVKKNATDSALIIDAMDLLHSRRFEGFCLVSNDSDFTRLATRLKEDGLMVFGLGTKAASKAFISACDRYVFIENLLVEAPVAAGEIPSADIAPLDENSPELVANHVDPVTTPTVAAPVACSVLAAPSSPSVEVVVLSEVRAEPLANASLLLLDAYLKMADDEGPWVMLGKLSQYIRSNHSEFDPRTYGHSKFKDLVEASGEFDLELRDYKNGQTWYCHPRSYRDALKHAVAAAAGHDGWAAIVPIGQKLREMGRSLHESGHKTLTDALKSAGCFDFSEAGNMKTFRLSRRDEPVDHE